MINLVLASASPRRQELLSLLGVPFDIVATDAEYADSHVPDNVVHALPSCSLPQKTHPTLLAWRKVFSALQMTSADVVLGADTVVVLNGRVLNKPNDAPHACEMLSSLSGQVHTVYTGLCLFSRTSSSGISLDRDQSGSFFFDLVASNVTIAPLEYDEITRYVATGTPLDKAGAYGIQDLGEKLVNRVEGSFTAVVGLPLPATVRLLSLAGITGLNDPTDVYIQWLHAKGKEPMPCPPTFP